MKRSTVVSLFTAGSLIGIPLAVSYALTASSEDRYFHGFIILSACSVSFPAIVIFLRSTLQLLDMAIKNDERMRDLGSVAADAKEVIGAVRSLIEDVKEQNPGRIIEFLEKLQKDGSIEKIATSVEAIAKKAHEVLERGKVKEGAAIEVPNL